MDIPGPEDEEVEDLTSRMQLVSTVTKQEEEELLRGTGDSPAMDIPPEVEEFLLEFL